MTWLVSVALRPIGALLLFGFALILARVLYRMIPAGALRTVLYDRTIRKRHPWKFFFLAAGGVWGAVALIGLYYHFRH
jgi:hypothetical protein